MKMFYAISLKSAEESDSEVRCPEERVFQDKAEALKCLKSNKQSRLKSFESEEDALEFASETIVEQTQADTKEAKVQNEGCPNKSLTPQQLKQLKDAIKRGNEDTFFELIESNPRYLMTPCDTPSVIHSGTRANPLHVAAESGSSRMTTLVLDAIQDPKLMVRMYPEESPEARARRQEYLFDLYLNSHLKGNFETPLHQATKIGAVDVVALLVQYSSCDTTALNKYDMTPADAAGTRMAQDDPDVIKQIRDLLSDRVYIPVFRVNDDTTPAFVGDPWSPRPNSNKENEEGFDLAALSPVMVYHQVKTTPTSGSLVATPRPNSVKPPKSPYLLKPPRRSRGDASPVYSVQAILGPMSPQEATQIKNEWKRPRSLQEKLMRLSDPRKGLERHGRALAKKCDGVYLIEYWDFLDAYADLSVAQGMELLDEHLRTMTENYTRQAIDHEESFSMSMLAKEMADLKLKDDSSNKLSLTWPDVNDNGLEEMKEINANNEEEDDKLPSVTDTPDNSGDGLSPDAIWNRPRFSAVLSPGQESQDSLISCSPTSSFSDSFHTVASSLDSFDSVMTADEGQWTYIGGQTPTEMDNQVYRVIQDVDVDERLYPYLAIWKSLISTYSLQERESWPKVALNVRTELSSVSKRLFD